ncbi:hypothetical protein CFP65_6397 [Kitasatospora sp. MMS16-BH015]|uniref:DUF2398 family protein n=1 Tax=Kitasatospora sp. MMS16-BH015 TaxID=2018025 RepID=UPI000CA3C2E9|nr:DUF2398 family protein [Kitasatospora sp. MMS16-BH015]AUG81053.1 hypothetical protein CFP65_6397 [Kitasatospora sp. MMS16-BH015]
MEQYEYATGPGEGAGGVTGGRGAGAGQLTAAVRADVHLALAERLATAEAEAAHELFTAAFGLYGARHLGGTAGAEAAQLSWWHGPTVRVPQPRRAGRGARRAERDVVPAAELLPAGSRRGRHRKPEQAPGSTPHATAVERRTAARLLAAHPLVTAAGPHGAGFRLIRRHADWLAERFLTVLGYPLTIGDSYARLHKAGLPGRGLAGFGPAGYAELVRALGALAEGRPAEITDEAVRRLLAHWRVLTQHGADHELARALGPLAAPAAGTPALAVRRRLAESPVVLLDELSGPERAWLAGREAAEAALFADFLGLEAEIRAEGIALLDPADELTDLAGGDGGTLTQAALLLVERLVEELRPLPEESAPPAVLIPDALIDGALGDVTDEHGAQWSRGYLADLAGFRRDALELLRRMELIAPAGRAWVLRAPAARYAAPLEVQPGPGPGRHSRRELNAAG